MFTYIYSFPITDAEWLRRVVRLNLAGLQLDSEPFISVDIIISIFVNAYFIHSLSFIAMGPDFSAESIEQRNRPLRFCFIEGLGRV